MITHDICQSWEVELARLKKRLEEAEKVILMVEDNSKMPHQHTDYYLRLCCLSERAREYQQKYGNKNEQVSRNSK